MAVWPILMLTCSSHPTSMVHVISYGYILYFANISLIELIIICVYQRLFHHQSHSCSKHHTYHLYVPLRCVTPNTSACFFYLRLSRTSVYASWLWIVIREISEKLQEKFRVPNSVVAVGHPAGGANMALTKLRRYVSA